MKGGEKMLSDKEKKEKMRLMSSYLKEEEKMQNGKEMQGQDSMNWQEI